jgi:uncharacterized damage-inducible protein DinB
MEQTERIERLMREMIEGPGWHGPGILMVLEGIDAGQAVVHPVEGAHSIREIVLHVIAWHEILLERLAGERRELTAERDWPPVGEAGEDAWRRDVERLRAVSERTREAVLRTAPDDLDLPLPGAKGTMPRYLSIHGLIHHDAWHAGQIALLRRALGIARPE